MINVFPRIGKLKGGGKLIAVLIFNPIEHYSRSWCLGLTPESLPCLPLGLVFDGDAILEDFYLSM